MLTWVRTKVADAWWGGYWRESADYWLGRTAEYRVLYLDAESARKTAESRLAELAAEQAASGQAAYRCEERATAAEGELVAVKEVWSAQRESLTTVNDHLHQRVATLEAERATLAEQLAGLRTTLAATADERDALRAEVTHLLAGLDRLKGLVPVVPVGTVQDEWTPDDEDAAALAKMPTIE